MRYHISIMRPHPFLFSLRPLAILLSGVLIACSEPTLTDDELAMLEDVPSPTWPTEVPAGKIDFKKHVRPLLIINCMECHNSTDAPTRGGDLRLDTRELAMTTGSHPPAIVPGDPDASLLITVLSLDPLHQTAMPPAPDKIWGIRLEILRKWIREGADWPESVTLVHPAEITEW